MVIKQKRICSSAPGTGVFVGGWSASITYAINDIVNYSGALYKALTSNSGSQPDVNPSDWEVKSPITVENSDVDTGTESVDQFSDDLSGGCRWDYIINNGSGTNMRAGSIIAVWDGVSGSSPVYTEYTTGDIGDTSGVSLEVDKLTNTIRLRVIVTTDDWVIRAQRYLI